MTAINSWQAIAAEAKRRISARIWKPGDLIPGEVELADEFGCARATVNRALRELAEAGLLERKRKAGTRVASNPVRKAVLDIPIIRLEVEQRGETYRHAVLEREEATPPLLVASRLDVPASTLMLHLKTLHFADGQPFLFEDRWINIAAVPDALTADFAAISANEWLVGNAPFTNGDIAFSAASATAEEAELLSTRKDAAIFVIKRTTWNGETPITLVRLAYAPGYRMHTTI